MPNETSSINPTHSCKKAVVPILAVKLMHVFTINRKNVPAAPVFELMIRLK
jgi:hypothetical protein